MADDLISITENLVEIVEIDGETETLLIVSEDQVEVLEVGMQGPVGPAGPSYDHTQSSASATWVINHNLGFKPQVEIRDAGGSVVWAEIQHVSVNQVQVNFASAQTGTARLA